MSGNSKEIRVEFSLTVNLGNYNSAKLGCMLEDELLPGEDFDEKFDQVYAKIRGKVRKELTYLTHEVKTITMGEHNE